MRKIRDENYRMGTAFYIMAFLLIFLSIKLDAFGAEVSDTNGLFALSLEELMNVNITSSARRSQSLGRATRAMYVINSDDIRQAGPVRIEELLRQVPGMDVSRTKGLVYEVGSRGYSKWNNERMQILLDGQPMYDPYLGGSMLYLNPIFLEDIERIEVIRGSAGVTWGVNAMNGVVNIISKKAADTQGGLIYGAAGSHGLHQGFIRYGSTNKSGSMAWRFTLGDFYERGFVDRHDFGTGTSVTDDYDAFQATGRVDLKLEDGVEMTLTGGHQNSTAESHQYGNLLWKKTFDDDSSFQVRWTESFISRTKVKNYYTGWGESDATEYNKLYSVADIDSREEMIEIQHNFLSGRHNIVWGMDYTRDVYQSTSRNGEHNTTPTGYTNNQVSAFIEDEITLADNLWYTIGYRGYYNDMTDFDWAGSTALVWEFKPKHFLRGSVSRSFRRPTMWQMFRSGPSAKNGYRVDGEGNDSLRNESQVSYEIGYRGEWAKNLSVNIEGYVDKDKDMMAVKKSVLQTYYPWPSGWPEKYYHDEWDNVYDVTTYGVETSIEWKPYEWWLVRAFHVYTHQTNFNQLTNWRTGETGIVLSPKNKMGLTNRFVLDEFTTLNTQLYWTGATTKSAEYIEGKAYWQLDVRLSRRIWNDTAEIAIGATNLLNQSHNEGGGYGDWDASPELTEVPQTFYFQFFYKF